MLDTHIALLPIIVKAILLPSRLLVDVLLLQVFPPQPCNAQALTVLRVVQLRRVTKASNDLHLDLGRRRKTYSFVCLRNFVSFESSGAKLPQFRFVSFQISK